MIWTAMVSRSINKSLPPERKRGEEIIQSKTLRNATVPFIGPYFALLDFNALKKSLEKRPPKKQKRFRV